MMKSTFPIMKSKLLIIKIILTLFLFLTVGCSSPEVNTYQKYVIKENTHKTRVKPLSNPYFVKFDSTIIYNLKNDDQYDLNKLPGWSKNINPRHTSHRIGFRLNNSKELIEMYNYRYFYKEREYREEISDSLLYGVYEIGEEIIISYPDSLNINTNLYFGGNEKAPHDINIYIKNKNE